MEIACGRLALRAGIGRGSQPVLRVTGVLTSERSSQNVESLWRFSAKTDILSRLMRSNLVGGFLQKHLRKQFSGFDIITQGWKEWKQIERGTDLQISYWGRMRSGFILRNIDFVCNITYSSSRLSSCSAAGRRGVIIYEYLLIA
jgi:hypothetical protein